MISPRKAFSRPHSLYCLYNTMYQLEKQKYTWHTQYTVLTQNKETLL